MITVVAAPPCLTVQDDGRVGHRALGVPPSGTADPDAAHAVNAIVGNDPGAAVLEWAAGGGALRFDVPLVVALGGAVVEGTLDGRAVEPYRRVAVRAGGELRVARLTRGRFLYLAVRGGIDVPLVLGSRSTLVSAAIGGHDGRRLQRGDVLRVSDALAAPQVVGSVAPPDLGTDAVIHVTPGPHRSRVGDAAWQGLLAATWRVTHASDRVGVRLDGPALASIPAAYPSEPTCVGAVQLPPDGRPIVLMPDGPTVGGYPIVAVVQRHAFPAFAQRAPGDPVHFQESVA